MTCEHDAEFKTKSLTAEVGFLLGKLMHEVPQWPHNIRVGSMLCDLLGILLGVTHKANDS
jgi:hypothetical protein